MTDASDTEADSPSGLNNERTSMIRGGTKESDKGTWGKIKGVFTPTRKGRPKQEEPAESSESVEDERESSDDDRSSDEDEQEPLATPKKKRKEQRGQGLFGSWKKKDRSKQKPSVGGGKKKGWGSNVFSGWNKDAEAKNKEPQNIEMTKQADVTASSDSGSGGEDQAGAASRGGEDASHSDDSTGSAAQTSSSDEEEATKDTDADATSGEEGEGEGEAPERSSMRRIGYKKKRRSRGKASFDGFGLLVRRPKDWTTRGPIRGDLGRRVSRLMLWTSSCILSLVSASSMQVLCLYFAMCFETEDPATDPVVGYAIVPCAAIAVLLVAPHGWWTAQSDLRRTWQLHGLLSGMFAIILFACMGLAFAGASTMCEEIDPPSSSSYTGGSLGSATTAAPGDDDDDDGVVYYNRTCENWVNMTARQRFWYEDDIAEFVGRRERNGMAAGAFYALGALASMFNFGVVSLVLCRTNDTSKDLPL